MPKMWQNLDHAFPQRIESFHHLSATNIFVPQSFAEHNTHIVRGGLCTMAAGIHCPPKVFLETVDGLSATELLLLLVVVSSLVAAG